MSKTSAKTKPKTSTSRIKTKIKSKTKAKVKSKTKRKTQTKNKSKRKAKTRRTSTTTTAQYPGQNVLETRYGKFPIINGTVFVAKHKITYLLDMGIDQLPTTKPNNFNFIAGGSNGGLFETVKVNGMLRWSQFYQ